MIHMKPNAALASGLDTAADMPIVQLVAVDGSAMVDERYDSEFDDGLLVDLYDLMVVTRELDEEFINLQRQGQLALFPSCRGQEAAQVGCVTAVRSIDWLFPQYRELGVFLGRGVEPGGIGAAWRGTWHGGFGFLERNIAPMSIPIGTQCLHAVGAAMAGDMLGDGSIAVAFLGDGATSEGDVHEALNFAAVFNAPCVFYVQNNQWAISVPLSEQLRAPSIAHKAIGYGMPGVRVDGNDVLACYAVVAEAAMRARNGGGPTLIEAITYRLGPHTTSDDPGRYRSPSEEAAWTELDPIPRFRRHLQSRGVWSNDCESQALEKAAQLRTQLREAVYDAPDLDVLEMFDHVFADPTPDLRGQRAQLAQELAGADLGP